ncbi:MAG: hypothetical protein JW967_01185, partial [Dehalococcoidales bacterium]|nr:hypothetical protein [Dehalococcoidales bacterium]
TALKGLRCGGDFIGIARTGKTLKTYEKWHKTLRNKFAQDVMAKDISDIQRDFSNVLQDVGQQLRRFRDFEYLPGHCELCKGSYE